MADLDMQQLTPPIINEDPLKAQETAMMWQTVWPQLIAMSWASDEFKAVLIKDPLATIRTVFNDRFQFPSYLKLEIIDPATLPDGGAKVGYNPQIGVWKLPDSTLSIVLPPKPTDQDAPLALINYQASGRIFPFSSF